MEQKRIYLDSAATTPLSRAAMDAMAACGREAWGNPSSLYGTGRQARARLEKARRDIADTLGVQAEEIYFTSGGSESDNWALKGVIGRWPADRARLVTTQVEHPALLNTALYLRDQGYPVTFLPVDVNAAVSVSDARAALEEETRLVSVMAANNEVGTLEPVAELAALAHEHGALFHTDAVQAIGLYPGLIPDTGADLLSLSAHKFGGPKGTGVLYIRRGTPIGPLIHGGEQERGLRASTENVPACCGMAAALKETAAAAPERREKLALLRDIMVGAILSALPDAVLNGDPVHHLPGHMHWTIPGVKDEALIPLLDLNGVEASAGSACTAGSFVESHVLKAMGLSGPALRASLRLTPSWDQTPEDMLRAAEIIVRTVRKLRGQAF